MEEETFTYLTSNTMATISTTLSLAATVTSFDCIELWTVDSDGSYYCPYVYATPQLQARCPHLLTGHHPRDKIDHVLSPKLCEYAKKSLKRSHWRVFPTPERPSDAYQGVTFPVLTEMAYYLENTGDIDMFIVGLATEKLQLKPSIFKYLQGLCSAIYVSAFILDHEGVEGLSKADNIELDLKEFDPKNKIITPYISAVNLASMGGGTLDVETIRRNISSAQLRDSFQFTDENHFRERASSVGGTRDRGFSDCDIGMVLDSPTAPSGRKSISVAKDASPLITTATSTTASNTENTATAANCALQVPIYPEAEPDHAVDEESDTFSEDLFNARYRKVSVDIIQTRNRAPTWDPTYPFSFPVGEIPSNPDVPDNLTNKDFSKITHICDGSNSNIYTAQYKNEKVIIKMIKEGLETDAIALHEFDLEYGMLSRMNHPHIIHILGAGYEPRRFMVLEYLSGGSLNDLLAQNEAKKGFANLMFRKPTFTYQNLLQKALHMAEALDYLHFHCHPGATIIHRDLKPDNIGFAADGTLKLFDFGLVTCVRTRQSSSEAYNMTGYTGSLRYMAPEVALREPYTEKVDVYSFGIMLWQMARDQVPFSGLGKTAFMQEVVRGHIRPKLDRSWPEGFNTLLTSCWARDSEKRPGFKMIIHSLNNLLASTLNSESSQAKGRIIKGIGIDKINSSWF